MTYMFLLVLSHEKHKCGLVALPLTQLLFFALRPIFTVYYGADAAIGCRNIYGIISERSDGKSESLRTISSTLDVQYCIQSPN